MTHNLFNSLQTFNAGSRTNKFYSLPELEKQGIGLISKLPVSIRIVLESVLRNYDGKRITEANVHQLASWQPNAERTEEIPFVVARILLQDFTGVPLLVDLAAMRAAVARLDKSPAFDPEILAGMAQMGAGAAEPMKQTPMYQLYARIAPKPADWPVLLTKMGELLRKDYDWSNDVAAIKAPTLLVYGDADAVRTAHAVQFFELLGGGKKDAGWDGSGMSTARLAILPGLTHYNVFSSPALASTVMPFLDAPMPGAR